MARVALTVDGVPIAYEESGHGPALVFVHGLGDARPVWSEMIARLSDAYRCVALDLRGHGASGASAHDYEAFGLARDVEAVLTALGLPGAVLVGHSLGGFVASVTAAGNPGVRGVVNVDQPLALAELAVAVRGLGPALIAQPVVDVLMAVLTQLGVGPLSSQALRRLRATREKLSREVLLGAWAPFLAGDDVALTARIDALLEHVTCPYLSVHGCRPPADYPRWLEARLPLARVVSWPEVGHFPHLCAVDRLEQLLRDWLHGL